MSRLRRRAAGLLATAALLGLVIGLPIVLLAVGANPIPNRAPSWEQVKSALIRPDDGTLALGAVTVIAWAAWLFITAPVVLETVSRLRGITTPTLPGLRLPQTAARVLVSTAMMLFVAAPALVNAAPAANAAPSDPSPTSTHNAVSPPATSPTDVQRLPANPQPSRERPVPPAASPRSSTVEYIVRRGDSLWSIAAERLGAGTRYVEIAQLNADLLHGRPGFLTPGMTLRLPAENLQRDDQPGPAHQVTVDRGDTLSEIAEDELGDAHRYPEIYRASTPITQPGGARLTDPDVIDIGWTLNIPGAEHNVTGRQADRPKTTSNSGGDDQHHRSHTKTGSPTAPAKPKTATTPGADRTTTQPSAPASPARSPRSSDTGPTSNRGPASAPGTNSPTEMEGSTTPTWLLTGLTGGGLVLAGCMLTVLRRRRHSQFRHRRPGRTIPTPDPALSPVEKTVAMVGDTAAPTVTLMDTALRRLAAAQAAAGQPMPHLTAVELTRTHLTLHLSDPAELPPPWQHGDTPATWTLTATAGLNTDAAEVDEQPAPYPLLVTTGVTEAGAVWFLNYEQLGIVSITGDPTFSRDFARYLSAELACNPWSHGVTIDCVGVADEVAAMNPERVTTHAGADPIADAVADAVAMVDRTTHTQTDVMTARADQTGADTWPARLILLDLTEQPPSTLNQSTTLDQLTTLIHDHPGRTATSVVLLGETTPPRGVVVHLDDRGRVTVPEAHLNLTAVGLTSDEALGCASLLAQADDISDTTIPAPAEADGWRAYADMAGALRSEHTLPRHTPPENPAEPSESLLPADDGEYVADAATTVEDLAVLAPLVPATVRTAVAGADPTLDEDLAAWLDPDCPLPRLTLLGPVGARTHGTAVVKRKPYYTELLAYLALRPHGATPDEVAEAFTITPARVRNDIKTLRDWLGTNPRTGRKHLPDARESAAAQARGVSIYQVEDVLTDTDLFRRLRVRGETRGPDGIADLRIALALVTGQPFDKLRTGGWTWLYEGDRIDHHMVCAIVDVAHIVTTHSLNDNNPTIARAAAEIATLAAPYEEIPRLDLAAIASAEGHNQESDRILHDDVGNRSDDGQAPTELPDRTAVILRNRDWLKHKAS